MGGREVYSMNSRDGKGYRAKARLSDVPKFERPKHCNGIESKQKLFSNASELLIGPVFSS